MNKARRHELKMLKYKKRLRLTKELNTQTLANPKGVIHGNRWGNTVVYNFTALRSTSKPCSCLMCSSNKYNRAKEKMNLIAELS